MATQWGRSATPSFEGVPQKRYGRRSILCALAALGIVVTSFAVLINLPSDTSEQTADLFSLVAVVAYLGAAPLLHITGFVYAVFGLIRSAGKVSSIIGLLLNTALFGIGVLLLVMAGSSLTAFR